jgi:hypothetical protein
MGKDVKGSVHGLFQGTIPTFYWRETTRNPSQGSRYPGRDSNSSPTEYNSEILPLSQLALSTNSKCQKPLEFTSTKSIVLSSGI